MSVTYDEGVFEELINLSFYLADEDESAAQRFLDACDSTFQFLADNPLLGSPRKFKDLTLAEIRMWRVKSFEKYLIFYIFLVELESEYFTFCTVQPTTIVLSKENKVDFYSPSKFP